MAPTGRALPRSAGNSGACGHCAPGGRRSEDTWSGAESGLRGQGASAACASAVAAEHALPGILRQAEPLRKAGPQPPPPRPVGDRATPRGRGSRSGSLASSLPAAHSARCTPLCPGPLGAGQRRVSCLGGSGVPVQLSGADAGGCPLCHSWTAAWGGDKGAGGAPTPTHPCCRGGAGHTARHRHPSLVSPPL